jgi:hypothetical protein
VRREIASCLIEEWRRLYDRRRQQIAQMLLGEAK